MDLSPEALQAVKFRGAVRGYHTGEVDDFIEKVAAGVRELLDQLRKANERAAKAEAAPKGEAPSDEAVQRTLMHAQKTADAVISDARQEAAKVIQEAEEQARRLRIETRDKAAGHISKTEAARAEAERLLAEAEADREKARAEVEALLERAATDVDKDLIRELDRLAGVRSTLQRECAALERWLEEQRQSLRALLSDALAVIEQAPLPVGEPVKVTEVETRLRPPGSDEAPSKRERSGRASRGAEPAPEARQAPQPAPAPEPEPSVQSPVWAAPATPAASAAPPAQASRAKPKRSTAELSDDDFLAELKRAAESTEPLGESR